MKPSIVFFGTGPVSLHCLEGIHEAFTVEAIVTKPDRVSPSGKTHDHPVKEFGAAHSIPVHQVATKHMLAELVVSQRFSSRVGLVVDFGMIIPPETIDGFELGIINSHFSLLPKLRGADPITFAILEGLETTGVSLMKIVEAMDEGDLLSQEECNITYDMTTLGLTEKLGELSNQILIRDLPNYITGDITPVPQTGEPSYTRRLVKADGVIDWSKPATELEREIRAYVGWPGSRTELHGREVTITAAHVEGDKLVIDRLKPAGKNEMSLADFERGVLK